MKAAVYYQTGPPDVFRYEEVPDPPAFPGGVLVAVEAISIEGGDTLNRAGGAMTATPHIVGYQCAGTIVEVGPGVEDRRVGQRVVATMMSGSHAEKVAVPALVTWPVPEGANTVGSAGRDPKPFDVSGLAMGNHSLTGVFLGAEIANERARAMIGRHVEDVAAGRLKVVVDRTYPLAEAAAAHAYLESRQAVGRVVLLP